MILTVARKNIWRKKVRSAVLLTAISLGIMAGIFNIGFYYGMIDQRVESAINTEVSHIQIHDTSYIVKPDIENYIENATAIQKEINSFPEVEASSGRIIINSMASTAETGSGIRIMGIDPETEKEVTSIHSRMTAGSYFEGDQNKPAVIGEELADELDVKVKEKIILHLSTVDGTMVSAMFRVAGLYKTSNARFDERNVFVRITDLAELTEMKPDYANEIAVLLYNNEDLQPVTRELSEKYPGVSVQSWDEIMPEVGLVEKSMDVTMYFIMLIILMALIFGIINTMLMAVMERVKEIGMLKAIGMSRYKIFIMIMSETIILALIGGLIGLAGGYLTIEVTSNTGINLSMYGAAWSDLGYDPVIYPTIGWVKLVVVTIMIIFAGITASIYPSLKAIRLNPAEALKIDM